MRTTTTDPVIQRAVLAANEQAAAMAHQLEALTPEDLGFDGMTPEELVASEWRCWFHEELREAERQDGWEPDESAYAAIRDAERAHGATRPTATPPGNIPPTPAGRRHKPKED